MIADTFLAPNVQPPGSPASSKRFYSSVSQCYKRFGRENCICLDALFVTRKKKPDLSSHKEWLIVFGHIPICWVCVARGCRRGFCEKLSEASPMSYRPNATWLQDGSAAGQG